MQSPSRWGQTEESQSQADTPERRTNRQQQQHQHDPSVTVITAQDLDVDEAEGALVNTLEERNRHARHPSITIAEGTVQHKIRRLEEAAAARRMDLVRKTQRRAASGHTSHLLHDIEQDEEEEEEGRNSISGFRGRRAAEKDGLMRVISPLRNNNNNPLNPYASNLDHHLLKGEEQEPRRYPFFRRSTIHHRWSTGRAYNERPPNNANTTAEGLPLHADYIATNPDGFVPNNNNNNNNNHPSSLRISTHGGPSSPTQTAKPAAGHDGCENWSMCHPFRIFNNCIDILVQSHFLWIGFPCLLGSAICFYLLDNPRVTFLPGDTTAAVWLLFLCRQTVTLGLARLSVYILVDGLMLGTHLAVKTLGPLVTLTVATGKGWPAIMVAWALWNLLIIHGDSPFQLNWLYWTEMDLFEQNFGGLLVNSVLYTRILFAAIIGGVFVSGKRTIFALRFGRKQVAEFKPRLKQILADVVLIDEIATLAEQADKEPDVDVEEEEESASWDLMSPSLVQQNLNEILWIPKIEYQDSLTSEFSSNAAIAKDKESAASFEEPAAMGSSSNNRRTTFASDTAQPAASPRQRPRASLGRTESGNLKIKDMLDSWEKPDTDSEKVSDISIHDILKFRRALSHLEEDNIFGDAFGSTVTRDQCIANSHSVYYKLLKLAKENHGKSDSTEEDDDDDKVHILPFDVLALLCLGDDGTENQAKKRKIRRLFTPDRSGGIPLLPFIQAIDQCYKRLVFLRASSRNASLLDRVLERLFNGIFYFVLVLCLSSVMQLHPWTLMVSITSLLVSVSFALGSSISSYVEGVFLIAVRRPFDLGDRIFMSSASSVEPLPDLTKNSWFVEDITLATTTLRYAKTNEVCTINNWSLSSTRIVNLARSPNAIVHFAFCAHISILDGTPTNNKFDQFRKAIQNYVSERPRVWESLAQLNHDMPDPDNESVELSMAMRHRHAWQEAGRIKTDRAEVFRFLYDLGNKLNLHFSAPVPQNITYQGGMLRRGDTDDCFNRDLIQRSNLRPFESAPAAARTDRDGATLF